jgi:hypothetical protein
MRGKRKTMTRHFRAFIAVSRCSQRHLSAVYASTGMAAQAWSNSYEVGDFFDTISGVT